MFPRRPRWSAVLWALCLVPSLAFSAWLFLWLQWYLPGEDQWGGEYVLAAWVLAGVVLGIGLTITPWRWKLLWIAAVLTPILPGLSWVDLVWFKFALLLGLGLMSVPFLAGAFVSRRWPGRWRWLVAVSLRPVLLTLEFSCRWSYQKSFWPVASVL